MLSSSVAQRSSVAFGKVVLDLGEEVEFGTAGDELAERVPGDGDKRQNASGVSAEISDKGREKGEDAPGDVTDGRDGDDDVDGCVEDPKHCRTDDNVPLCQ